MQFVKPAGELVPFAAPKDWDEKANGPCGTLPVRRVIEGRDGPSPFLEYYSNWKPSDTELARLNAGHVVELGCVHVQPAVSMAVVPCADSSVMPPARPVDTIRGAVARAWCQEPNAPKEMDADLAEAITQEIAKLFGIEGD